MEPAVEDGDTSTFLLNRLERINEQQEKIDELLCEAVEKRSIKATIILLDFAKSNLKLDAFDQAIGSSNIASDICMKWKEKKDIKPLILAAQNGLADFIKLFISRGYYITSPHDASCKCQQCETDSLQQSKERILLYKAISNPVWICLTCADPFVSSFRLCCELDQLKCFEDSYENEYEEMKLRCQDFCMSLLDEVGTTEEQYTLLNMSDEQRYDLNGERKTPSLKLLKLAIQYKQKKFVAHSIPQHFITSLVFNDVPKWRTSGWAYRFIYILFRAVLFPITSLMYILFPCSRIGRSIQQPLVRFIHGASSFVAFLGLLASLAAIPSKGIRIGKEPSALECIIFIWLISLLIAEINQLLLVGRIKYFSSGWNLMDITMIFFMLLTFITWGLLYFIQSEISISKVLFVRSLANGLFTFGVVMSFFRLVYLCQIARFLGLLQLCLGKMIEVIFQFAFISCVVLWSFSVGMVFLYNSRQDPAKVTITPKNPNATDVQSLLSQGFHGLTTTLVTLAWASLNMVDLNSLKVFDDGSVIYLWSSLLFTLYYGVSMIVLLNMLIAMMSNSYQQIENNIEVEHKYAKTQLWVDYIGYDNFLPCPFNIIPTWNTIKWIIKKIKQYNDMSSNENHHENCQLQKTSYEKITKLLVKKYLKSKYNVILEDIESDKWRERLSDDDKKFEIYVKNYLEKITRKELRFPFKKTTSLEDSGLDVSFPGESTNEQASVSKL